LAWELEIKSRDLKEITNKQLFCYFHPLRWAIKRVFEQHWLKIIFLLAAALSRGQVQDQMQQIRINWI